MATDPFSLTYAAIWSCLESNADLVALVPAGNRIRFDGDDRGPDKDVLTTADCPQLRVVAVSGNIMTARDSKGEMVQRNYQLQIMTGDQRLDHLLYPIEWEVYRAFMNWSTHFAGLTWGGAEFVKRVQVNTMSEGMSHVNDGGVAAKGWAALVEIVVDMYFNRASIAPS